MSDPVIDEVRRVRKMIAADFDSELSGMVEHYAKLEAQFKHQPIAPTDRGAKHCAEVTKQPLPDGGSSAAKQTTR